MFATFTVGYNHASPTSIYSCWTTTAICTVSNCRPAGWIAANVGHNVLVVCCCFQQWSGEHSHTHRQILDGCIVQMDVKISEFCEQWWPLKQHPGKKSGHMLHLLSHQGSLGTVSLQQDSDHVCLWPGYHLNHDITKHGYSGVMKESTGEWNGTLLTSVMRVCSFCMWVMDVHVYCVDLVSVTFGVHSPMTHRPHLRLHGVGGTSVITHGQIWCFCTVK